MPGYFISFEGTEGCGKSTQIKIMASRLQKEGHDVVTLREPGGTDSGEEIRRLLKHGPDTLTAEAELLLMNASRAQLVREIIRPALAEGSMVLCDRYYDSTTAYQGHGRKLDLDLVESVIKIAVGNTVPDLTLLLDIPVRISEQRRLNRAGTDRFEVCDRAFFDRVAHGYNALAKAHPDRVVRIDSTQSVETVSEIAWDFLIKKMKKDR